MKIKCTTCQMIITDEKIKRCPRCHSLLKTHPSCSSCKGCSLRGVCSK